LIVSNHWRNKRSQRGYTIVEIMSAMTLFAIGAAGVVGMQRVTVQGGYDARRFDTATNIAREWQSRLQRDSSYWTEPNSIVTGNINLNRTLWLNDINTSPGAWKDPPLNPSGMPVIGTSGAFDILGRDVTPGDPDQMYCVQYRLSWIANPGPAAPFRPTGVMKAEIRVFWSRLEKAPALCGAANPAPDSGPAQNYYHYVYVTTAIRENPDQ